ncbi:MBOAT-domain-containing protein [Daedaleopsis nitida]|nr:MBOAT-domain-containing protein [Daedaleopsis nitida]
MSSSSERSPNAGQPNGSTLAAQAVTPEGTLYVSQPYRSSSTNKLRAMVTFAPRKSLFDISNESSTTNEFRGFFTLFWMSLFLFAVGIYVRSVEATGSPLNFEFATMISRDAITLAISDGVLVLNTALCVPFAKAVAKGWLRYNCTGLVLQHLWQGAVLAIAITWTFNRQWPWVQSGFLTLHSFVMIMKMHSYISTNGELAQTHEQAEKVYAQLKKATDAQGGWEEALQKAEVAMLQQDSPIPSGTPGVPLDAPEGPIKGCRQRRCPKGAGVKTTGTRVMVDSPAIQFKPPSPSEILSHHPSEAIASLAKQHAELERDLTGSIEGKVRWPANITFRDFAWYQLTPTLVYELEYPRTDRIRPLYVFEKSVAFFGTFALLYTIVETFIIPLTPTKEQSFARSLLDLAIPFMISYLLLFYIIFECICNAFAELSYFADRQFYDAWWNSTSWDEFSRKWNRPVHTFLLRHVYASTMSSYKLTRQSAMFLTFLLSACAHELVMAVVTKKIRMYLFALQLAQIPLIAIGRIPTIRRNKLLGNTVFWIGLYAGFPLLCVAYCAY